MEDAQTVNHSHLTMQTRKSTLLYFAASGAQVIFQNLPTTGSKKFHKYLTEGLMDVVGAKWNVAEEPLEIAKMMIERIDANDQPTGSKRTEEGSEEVESP